MQISVVIPAYNSAATLARAIDSALGQTLRPAEIVVIDDGSTDNTQGIVRTYGERVCYRYQPNGGVSSARNNGVRTATSTWIGFLDSDDAWKPTKLEVQARKLCSVPDAALCYSAVETRAPNGRQGISHEFEAACLWPTIRHTNVIANSSVVMRRDLYLEVGGQDEELVVLQDWDLWFRVAAVAKIVGVKEPLTVICQTEGSLSSARPERMLNDLQKMLAKGSLTAGLSGVSRMAAARRAWAAELYRCSIVERQARGSATLSLLLRSLCAWPSPFFMGMRFKSLAVHVFRPT